jgi:hypothetical protein
LYQFNSNKQGIEEPYKSNIRFIQKKKTPELKLNLFYPIAITRFWHIQKQMLLFHMQLIRISPTYEYKKTLLYLKNIELYKNKESRDSSVGIALGYGLDDQVSRIRFPAGAGNFSLHHRVQNGSGAHPASYPMGTKGSFLGGKAAGA